MAVARITAPKHWHLKAAEALKGVPRGSRELTRAAARPGLTAELTGDEVRALAVLLPKDARVAKALADLEASEVRERARPRARDVVLARMQRERMHGDR